MIDTLDTKQRILKALVFWAAGVAIVAGFMYYHSNVPLGPVLVAIVVTLLLTIWRARKP